MATRILCSRRPANEQLLERFEHQCITRRSANYTILLCSKRSDFMSDSKERYSISQAADIISASVWIQGQIAAAQKSALMDDRMINRLADALAVHLAFLEEREAGKLFNLEDRLGKPCPDCSHMEGRNHLLSHSDWIPFPSIVHCQYCSSWPRSRYKELARPWCP